MQDFVKIWVSIWKPYIVFFLDEKECKCSKYIMYADGSPESKNNYDHIVFCRLIWTKQLLIKKLKCLWLGGVNFQEV